MRSDAAGEKFDGQRIQAVNVRTRETRILYRTTRGAHCGVVTWNPVRLQLVFIHGPEDPRRTGNTVPFLVAQTLTPSGSVLRGHILAIAYIYR